MLTTASVGVSCWPTTTFTKQVTKSSQAVARMASVPPGCRVAQARTGFGPQPHAAPKPRRGAPMQILRPVHVMGGGAHLDHVDADARAGQERQAARRRPVPEQE